MRKTRRSTWSVVVIALGLAGILLAGGVLDSATAQAKPEGEMRWALYV